MSKTLVINQGEQRSGTMDVLLSWNCFFPIAKKADENLHHILEAEQTEITSC